MSTSTYEDTAVAGAETPALMKAAVVHSFTEPLRFEEVAMPVPGAGEILVRIEASGLCHTDIHAAHGDWPVKPTPPFIPGHEGVGIVEQRRRRRHRRSRWATGSPCRGSATPAAPAITASPAGRRSARASGTPATPSTAASPSTSSAYAALRRPGARRRRPARRGAADLRRRHHLQGGQGLRRAARPTSSPSSASAASATWRCSTRGSPAARVVAVDVDDEQAGARRASSAPSYTVNAGERGPGRGDPGARRRRRRDRRSRSRRRRSSRPTARSAAAARSSSSACRRTTAIELPIFETVLERASPSSARSSARAATSREVFELHAAGAHARHPRGAAARRGQRGDRGRRGGPSPRPGRVRALTPASPEARGPRTAALSVS